MKNLKESIDDSSDGNSNSTTHSPFRVCCLLFNERALFIKKIDDSHFKFSINFLNRQRIKTITTNFI